ncbi:MAG: ATP-dependent helicase, partial [Candidatus Lindowbacteria bacterium]|nr:ATP-dependent helicase [Candidatus Lindowbacteria bacterium]
MAVAELDDIQRRAVESGAKTVIVTGGPGTGKTRVLTERFAYLTDCQGLALSSILMLTFSSASVARLMRDIEAIIRRSYGELWIHTCHSFAYAVLAEFVSTTAGSSQPAFITPFKEYLLTKEILRREQQAFRSDIKRIAHKGGLAREVSDFLGLLKQRLIGANDFSKATRNLSGYVSDIARVYSARDEDMKRENWVGVRDVIWNLLGLFETHPELLAQYRKNFSHILVDEFHEVDPSQLRLIELLASEQTALFATGDDEQRIYRFRGSGVGQFSDIEKGRREAGVERFCLKTNYRLPAGLQKASENLISHNRTGKPDIGNLSRNDASDRDISVSAQHATSQQTGNQLSDKCTETAARGGDVTVAQYEDAVEQAYDIARRIKREVLDSASTPVAFSYSDYAILCRSTARSAVPFEEALSYYQVPFVLYNAT